MEHFQLFHRSKNTIQTQLNKKILDVVGNIIIFYSLNHLKNVQMKVKPKSFINAH